MIRERERRPFSSFRDFCERMTGGELNKRAVENLIRSGAFDALGARRSQLLKVYETVMDSIAGARRQNVEGQLDFFSMGTENQEAAESEKEIPLPDIPEFTPGELMRMEKETTGLYLSGHPMDDYHEAVKRVGAVPIAAILEDFAQENGPTRFRDEQRITVAGVVTSSKTKTTKNNSLMAYVTLEDDSAAMELLCFSRVLDTCGSYLRENQTVAVRGKISVRDEKAPQILCDSAQPLTPDGQQPPEEAASAPVQSGAGPLLNGHTLYLKLPGLSSPELRHMKLVLSMFPGTTPVRLVMADSRKVLGTSCLLHRALVAEAKEVLGEEQVVIR